MSKYILMNKNTPVFTLEYNEQNHYIQKIIESHNPKYAPLQAFNKEEKRVTASFLQGWWNTRCAPSSRPGLQRFMDGAKIADPFEIVEKNFGAGLSDQYWMNDVENPTTWDAINFFTNDFSEDIGQALLGLSGSSPKMNFKTPNGTVDGYMKKAWKIVDGDRCLFKGGLGLTQQEPFNEVIATRLYERLLEPEDFVSYEVQWINKEPFSVCRNMLTTDEELIPAKAIMHTLRWSNSNNSFQNTIKDYQSLGLENVEQQLSKMMVCDFLIANSDRHPKNFGVIRDVNTLECTRIAPIFDNGMSLWSNKVLLSEPIDYEYQCCPFSDNPYRQLEMATDFSWFDPASLRGFDNDLYKILRDSPLAEMEKRIEGVVRATEKRMEVVKDIAFQRSNPLISVAKSCRDIAEQNSAAQEHPQHKDLGAR